MTYWQKAEKRTEELIKELISKATTFNISSLDHRIKFKDAINDLNKYHSTEVDPKKVENEYKLLLDKLNLHAMPYISREIDKVYKICLEVCLDSLPSEDYLIAHSVVYFLIEMHRSLLEYEYKAPDNYETIKAVCTVDKPNWNFILTYSDDIIHLTRQSYMSSDSEEEFNEEKIKKTKTDKVDPYTIGKLRNWIENKTWNLTELEDECKNSLQNQYWLKEDKQSSLRDLLKPNESNLLFDDLENYLKLENETYYLTEVKNRIELTEYQLIREMFDIFLGGRESTVFTVEYHEVMISLNRMVISKKCSLLNLSWGCLDNVVKKFSKLATHCLQISLVIDYIVHNMSMMKINNLSPSIISLAYRLNYLMTDFHKYVCKLEHISRSDCFGISLISLYEKLSVWFNRIEFLNDIVLCVTSGKFEAFFWNCSVINLLDLLYRCMKESTLLITDKWIVNCILDLFYHTFKPYLYSVDCCLSGGRDFSDYNLFVIYNYRDKVFEQCKIAEYWKNSFRLKRPDKPMHDVPILFRHCLVNLISTIKSIDLLRLLSTELNKPSIINPIVIEPGKFLSDLEYEQIPIVKCTKVVRTFVPRTDYQLPTEHILEKKIFQNIVSDMHIKYQKNDANQDKGLDNFIDSLNKEDLEERCRMLHKKLYSNILDRLSKISIHLISVFVNDLRLKKVLYLIKSTYFLQEGVEMYEICRYMFSLLLHRDYDAKYMNILMNEKIMRVFSESPDGRLREIADNMTIKFKEEVASNSEIRLELNILNNVKLNYNIEWFLKLIISDHVLEQCNLCFQFLLQLRFAKYCLETYMHLERHKAQTSISIRLLNRVSAQRLKLLQIVNTLYIYIMNRFVIPSWQEIQCTLDRPEGVGGGDDVLNFADFMFNIQHQFNVMCKGCLQTPDMKNLQNAIVRIINVAVRSAVFDSNVGLFKLMTLERDYKTLIEFVTGLLKRLENFGVFFETLDLTVFF